jgi:phospholipase C
MLDANGMPAATPLYANPKPGDAVLTQACPDQQNVPKEVRDAFVPGYACGDFAVNTVQPASQPFAPGTVDSKRLPAIDDKVFPNIGDELSARNVSWNWYSGGWDNAAGNVGGAGWTNGTTTGTCTDPDSKAAAVWPYCAGNLFQFHHQPLNYFANYAEHGPGRSHLQDEQNFLNDTRTGHLPAVSFVKPYGEENEHPGYASTTNGESHLVDLLKAIRSGPNAKDTLVVVTYDEFGGQWDHVPPPGQGPDAAEGPSDEWGPGTRIPALIIGGSFTRSGVDHQSHDTTSVLATIEHAFGLAPLTDRDAVVKDLGHALKVGHDRSGRAHRH